MKKFITAVFCLAVLPLASYAQGVYNPNAKPRPKKVKPRAWKGLVIAPSISGGVSTTNAVHLDFSGNNPGAMVVLGCKVGYAANDHLTFNTGMFLGTYSWSSTYNTGLMQDRYLNVSSYLQIPFTIKYTTSKADKIGFFIEGGASLGLLAGVTEEITYRDGGPSDIYTDANGSNPVAVASYLAMGVKFPISNKVKFYAGIENSYFLTDQLKDEKTNLMATGLRAGVDINWAKKK